MPSFVLYGEMVKMWDMGVRGKLWRVIRRVSRSAVFLGKKSAFSVEPGVAQGCSLYPIFFSIDLLKEVEKANLGIQLSSGKKVGGLLFADDFVGGCNLAESLQSLIDTVQGYCTRWKLSRSAVMIFSKHPRVVSGNGVSICWLRFQTIHS